ncbi:hypothetical protein QBC35DRAFT_448709 [Podospora australis]|uniref:Uncharacterized protein n=1 Tax=Podospora australis TaxID=1536484 RepID=A0AAN7AJL0_9PEZI|nr:hypothetical protein QBC35DRAFT_448709 [Podospora australis]
MSSSCTITDSNPACTTSPALNAQTIRARELGRARARDEAQKAMEAKAIAQALLKLSNGKKLSDSIHAPGNRTVATNKKGGAKRGRRTKKSKTARAVALPTMAPQTTASISKDTTTPTISSMTITATSPSPSAPIFSPGCDTGIISTLGNTTIPDASTLHAREMGKALARRQYEEAVQAEAIATALRSFSNGKTLADSRWAPRNPKN